MLHFSLFVYVSSTMCSVVIAIKSDGIKASSGVNKMAEASKSNVPQLSKWHLAIALGIGTPIALGVAYWYIKKNRDSKKSNTFSEDIYTNSVEDAKQGRNNQSSSNQNEKSFVPQVCVLKLKF